MKKKILVIMPAMFIGGAERSVLGLLEAFDFEQYDVSLFLYRHEGEFLKHIPKEVTLLDEVPEYRTFDVPIKQLLKSRFGFTGMTLFEYVLGALSYKYRVFSNLGRVWERMPAAIQYVSIFVMLAGMLYGHTKIVASLFIAPITGFMLMTVFHFWKKPRFIQQFFQFIGQHSTNIWLTHMFFYSVLFKNFVYCAKYPLLIFVLMLVITIAISMVLQWIEKPIRARIAAL